MAKVRGEDGTPVEVHSRPGGQKRVGGEPSPVSDPVPLGGHFKFKITPDVGEARTSPLEGAEHDAGWRLGAHKLRDDGDAATVPSGLLGESGARRSRPAGSGSDGGERPTVFDPDLDGAAAHPKAGEEPAPADFTTGWLVIVEGPGRGASLRLGFGPHTIGRSRNMRVRLDFGDPQISRENHAVVTYEPRGNRFFVQAVSNLVYRRVGGDLEPVLTPEELKVTDELLLGKTRLRFVSLCDESFTWKKVTDGKGSDLVAGS